MTLSPFYNTPELKLSDERNIILGASLRAMRSTSFVQDLDTLSGLIARLDPSASPLINQLDQKAGDLGTYYFAAFSDSHNLDVSLLAYRTVRSLVRYILLMDRFFEVGNNQYALLAKGILKSLKQDSGSSLRASIVYSLRTFWPFWSFEQAIKKRMVRGDIFNVKEIKQLNYSKSSDAQIIYSTVLECVLSDYEYNLASLLHFNQALQDLTDDFDDIEEDIADKMPNAFVLASASRIGYGKIFSLNSAKAREAVLASGAVEDISSIADSYQRSISRIELPEPFWFLKELSRSYSKSFEKAIKPYLK